MCLLVYDIYQLVPGQAGGGSFYSYRTPGSVSFSSLFLIVLPVPEPHVLSCRTRTSEPKCPPQFPCAPRPQDHHEDARCAAPRIATQTDAAPRRRAPQLRDRALHCTPKPGSTPPHAPEPRSISRHALTRYSPYSHRYSSYAPLTVHAASTFW